MTTPAKSSSLMLFIYSNGNILGCLFALLGLALYFMGFIDQGWPWIVAGLYLLGYLLLTQFAPSDPNKPQQPDNLLESLELCISQHRPKLPKAAQVLLESIQTTLRLLLPVLTSLEHNGGLSLHSRLTLTTTINHYLPDTLNAYLRLPPALALVHRTRDGKTAQQLLIEQLRTLDQQLQQIASSAYAQDLEQLALNGQFLAERFGPAKTDSTS